MRVSRSTDWLEDQQIELIHLGADAGKGLSSWKPVSEEVVLEGLRLLLNPQVRELPLTPPYPSNWGALWGYGIDARIFACAS